MRIKRKLDWRRGNNDHSIADGYVYTNMKIYNDGGEKARQALKQI